MKLIKFGATWCAPCKSYEATLSQIESEVGEVITIEHCDVDSDGAEELIELYSVRSVPTTIVIYDNGETEKHVGVLSKEFILGLINKNNQL